MSDMIKNGIPYGTPIQYGIHRIKFSELIVQKMSEFSEKYRFIRQNSNEFIKNEQRLSAHLPV